MIRVGDVERGTEGKYVTIDVPQTGSGKAKVTVSLRENVWELRADYGDSNPVIVENTIAGKANNVVILAEKALTISATPQTIR